MRSTLVCRTSYDLHILGHIPLNFIVLACKFIHQTIFHTIDLLIQLPAYIFDLFG